MSSRRRSCRFIEGTTKAHSTDVHSQMPGPPRTAEANALSWHVITGRRALQRLAAVILDGPRRGEDARHVRQPRQARPGALDVGRPAALRGAAAVRPGRSEPGVAAP